MTGTTRSGKKSNSSKSNKPAKTTEQQQQQQTPAVPFAEGGKKSTSEQSSSSRLPKHLADELQDTARRLTAPGKGILAADESPGSIGKRFGEHGMPNTEDNRRLYRQMLFGGGEQLAQYVSGVILHEETLGQHEDGSSGPLLADKLRKSGIIAGIKVDKGLSSLGGTNHETFTQGFDGLRERCEAYYKAGCRFAKWRSVLRITDTGEPSSLAICVNSRDLARYASICQFAGLVPIVEPEVLADGTHDIYKCQRVSERVLSTVLKALHAQHVLLEGILLKPNMVTPGHDAQTKASHADVAWATVTTLRRTVPPAVAGIMFLSGGQSEEEATANLNAINALDAVIKPWPLSFSFGRALQTSALAAWAGKPENVSKAQQELLSRAKANSAATRGKYVEGSVPHSHTAGKSNYVAKHAY